jgi:hypothetical protein
VDGGAGVEAAGEGEPYPFARGEGLQDISHDLI